MVRKFTRGLAPIAAMIVIAFLVAALVVMAKKNTSAPATQTPSATDMPTVTPASTTSSVPTTKAQSLSIFYTPHGDWETYTDGVAKFSLQYNSTPSGEFGSWLKLGDSKAGEHVRIDGCHIPPTGPHAGKEICTPSYRMTIHSNYDGGSRHAWLDTNIYNTFSPECKKYTADLAVAGKNALIATSDCSSFGETYVLIPNKPYMVVYFFSGYSRDDKTGKISLDDFVTTALSTFKFSN